MVSNADARVVKSGAHASLCMCSSSSSGCLGEEEKKESGKNKSRFFKGTRDKSRSGPSDIPLAAALIRSNIFFSILRVLCVPYNTMAHDGSFRDHEPYQ